MISDFIILWIYWAYLRILINKNKSFTNCPIKSKLQYYNSNLITIIILAWLGMILNKVRPVNGKKLFKNYKFKNQRQILVHKSFQIKIL
jgi:hypothetical protein